MITNLYKMPKPKFEIEFIDKLKKDPLKCTCDKAGTLSLSKNIVIGQDANEL